MRTIRAGSSTKKSPELIALMRAGMAKKGLDQRRLAETVGASESTISRLLNPGWEKGSRVLVDVLDELEIPVQFAVIIDPDIAAWFQVGEELKEFAPASFAAMLAQVQKMVGGLKTAREAQGEMVKLVTDEQVAERDTSGNGGFSSDPVAGADRPSRTRPPRKS